MVLGLALVLDLVLAMALVLVMVLGVALVLVLLLGLVMQHCKLATLQASNIAQMG